MKPFLTVLLFVFTSICLAESPVKEPQKFIPPGSKLYVAPIAGGFDTYIVAGIMKKRVPVVVVTDRDKADYEITGVSETQQAGWAKMLFLGSQQSNEQASFALKNIKTGEVIYAYSVNKTNSVRGKQSAGEACAKHLKEIVKQESVR